MTSSTDELCKLLDERGLSCQTNYLHTSWCVGPKLYEAVDNLNGTLTVGNLTPEQAIAATAGSEYHGYEQAAIKAWKNIKAWNTRATHGMLTAEQVREAIEKRFDFDVWVPKERWQAIADELNATLGNGTCEIVLGEDDYGCDAMVCSKCFKKIDDACSPNYCQNCGAKVVDK